MTHLQKKFFIASIIALSISALLSVVAFISAIRLHMLVSYLQNGSYNSGSLLIYQALNFLMPILSLLMVFVIRTVSAQSEGIAGDVIGLVWFGGLANIISLAISAIANIFLSRSSFYLSSSFSNLLLMNSYFSVAINTISAVGSMLTIAACGMQIYEKKM